MGRMLLVTLVLAATALAAGVGAYYALADGDSTATLESRAETRDAVQDAASDRVKEVTLEGLRALQAEGLAEKLSLVLGASDTADAPAAHGLREALLRASVLYADEIGPVSSADLAPVDRLPEDLDRAVGTLLWAQIDAAQAVRAAAPNADASEILAILKESATLDVREAADGHEADYARGPGRVADRGFDDEAFQARLAPHLEGADPAAILDAARELLAAVDSVWPTLVSYAQQPSALSAIGDALGEIPEIPTVPAAPPDILDLPPLVAIDGTSGNEFTTFYILTLDLGGDDHYYAGNTAGGASLIPSLSIDLRGDDNYFSGEAYAGGPVYYSLSTTMGAGVLSAGVLLDVMGDDDYGSDITLTSDSTVNAYRTLLQGAGSLGVGVFVDGFGSDDHLARLSATSTWNTVQDAYLQGAGLLGVGVMADVDGNDIYLSSNLLTEKGNTCSIYFYCVPNWWSVRSVEGAGYGALLVLPNGQIVTVPGAGLLVDGTGNDRMISDNDFITLSSESAIASFRVTGAQGSGLNGVGALLAGDGSLSAVDQLADCVDELDLAGAIECEVSTPPSLSGGADSYISHNYLYAEGGVDNGAYGGEQYMEVQFVQGATGNPSFFGSYGGYTRLGAGIFVDLTGRDQYNSYNDVITYGARFVDDPGSGCRVCHALSQIRVACAQGYTGEFECYDYDQGHGGAGGPTGPGGPGEGGPTGGRVGLMVEASGSDTYNSYQEIIADTYTWFVMPVDSQATYYVDHVQGHALGDPFYFAFDYPITSMVGSLDVGALVDLGGNDVYNTGTLAEAREGHYNFATGSFQHIQGTAFGDALAAHLDVGVDGFALPAALPQLTGAQDAYNSYNRFNVIPCDPVKDQWCTYFPNYNYESFSIYTHLGSASSGIALFGDANVLSSTLTGGGAVDVYDHKNVADDSISIYDGFGRANAGYAFFLELFGANEYVTANGGAVPFCGDLMGVGWGTVTWPVLGTQPAIGVFRDVGGMDTYDACTPGLNEAVWATGTGDAEDLLSTL